MTFGSHHPTRCLLARPALACESAAGGYHGFLNIRAQTLQAAPGGARRRVAPVRSMAPPGRAPGLLRSGAGLAYCAVQPPSTGRTAPVIRHEARDESNTTAAATSAVVPTRPIGMRARTPARNVGSSKRPAVPGG